MRQLSFVIIFILALSMVWTLGCGSSSPAPVQNPTPTPQTTTSIFAFMQSVAGQSGLYSPMIGTFATTAGVTQFSSAAVIESASNQVVTGDFYSVALSADGKKVAVDLFGGLDRNTGHWDIWVANLDGSNMTQLTTEGVWNQAPQFSPDGSKVIYVSQRTSGGDGSCTELAPCSVVARMVDGSSEQVFTMPTGLMGAWAPTYSADGSKIAMEVWGYYADNSFYDGIAVMDADGGNLQLMTNPAAVDGNLHDQTPSFSANGSKIAFSRHNWNSRQEDVYIMNSDGSGVTQLTDSVGNSFEPIIFNIAGLGERILFSSNRANVTATGGTGYELYSMKLDGTELTRLTNNALYDSFNYSYDPVSSESVAQQRRSR